MGDFSAIFVKVDGTDETDLGQHFLNAETLEAAVEEAQARAPREANSIKICREGQMIHRVMVGL